VPGFATILEDPNRDQMEDEAMANVLRSAIPIFCVAAALTVLPMSGAGGRPRAREAGVRIGILQPGPLNAITDVDGVKVGQVTLVRGAGIRTGVTAVLPHGGNLFQEKVPAGFVAANAFGKFIGSTQIEELGEVETPILLTNTLNVAEAAAAAVEWTLAQPGNEQVRSVNAVVGETNDGFLNDIRGRHVSIADARRAIENARAGAVEEGSVGAGTGTVAFGYKGGIGTASRRLPASLGGWTIGALVQSNYGGVLTIEGVPVGVRLGRYDFREEIEQKKADGSVVIVVATDAPLSDRNLRRLAERAFAGIARTGSGFSNGSGDYAIAFSTHPAVRRTAAKRAAASDIAELPNDAMSPLFQAVAEASEEAALNSLFAATTMTGDRGTIEALPLDRVLPMLPKAGD
jgi:D-aminopeptidase